MKKLVELLKQHPCNGDVGVEIECEGVGIRESESPFWRTEKDGSLRGQYPSEAAEFVMTQPVHIDHVGVALDHLIAEQAKAKFDFSFRTSVHVHVNVQQLTEPEMLAFLYLCLLVEEPLMNFCGETRKANRFCLRYADAEGFDRTLDALFDKGYSAIRRLDGEKIRYAAINVHALQKYGSIEFRGMRGNMDKDVILPWCQTLIHLRNRAQELGSPINVFNRYIAMGNTEFIDESLGPHAEKFAYDGQQKDVERSFSLTIDLPHIFKGRKEVVEVEYVAPVPRPRAAPIVRVKTSAKLIAMYRANEDYEDWVNEEENEDADENTKIRAYISIFIEIKNNMELERNLVEEELIREIRNIPAVKVAAQFGVWDVAVGQQERDEE